MTALISLMAVIGILIILYGTFLAQRDLKKMIAYLNISLVGYVTFSVAALVPFSVSGAMYQQFSHGLIPFSYIKVVKYNETV